MSVHQRSPLCADYLDYYKPVTTRFRREIDQKFASRDATPMDGMMNQNKGPTSQWEGLTMMVENANAELLETEVEEPEI